MIREIYLHSYILENIINYIYKRSRFFDISQNNNELIGYSLVCRSWFNLVSKLISNKQTLKNINSLISLTQDSPTNQTESQINHTFKLIKFKDSSIYINSFEDYNSLPDKSNKRITYVNHYDRIESFEYPSNFKFRSVEINTFLNTSKDYEKDISKIKCLRVENKYELLQSLKFKINKVYYVDIFDNKFNIFIGFKRNHNSKINIDDLFIPSDSNLTMSNLKKFYTKLSANHLLRVLKDSFGFSNIKEAWTYIADKLSNCGTLIELIYFHLCIENKCNCGGIEGISKEDFNNGIKTIISSSNTNLKTLRFSPGPINDSLFESLQINSTIRDISIQATCLPDLISKILIKNKTIRNVLINSRGEEHDENKLYEGLKLLVDSLYLDRIDLYSISIQVNKVKTSGEIIKILTSDNINFNIKEFNIINNNSNIQDTYQFIYNKSIFNIKNDMV